MIRSLTLMAIFVSLVTARAGEPDQVLYVFDDDTKDPRKITIRITGHDESERTMLERGFSQRSYEAGALKKTINTHSLSKLVGPPDLVIPKGEALSAASLIEAWRRQGEGRLFRVDVAPAPMPYSEYLSSRIARLLDTNQDGRVSRAEAEAAPKLLDKFDADEDGCLIALELVPSLLTEVGPKRPEMVGPTVVVIRPGYTKEDVVAELKTVRPKATPEQLNQWMALTTHTFEIGPVITTGSRRVVGPKGLEFFVVRGDESPAVTLSVTNQARGWFERLDINGDGQLSQRELRSAWKSLKELAGSEEQIAFPDHTSEVLSLTLATGKVASRGVPLTVTRQKWNSPDWFAAWDRNGDGDLDRREFLGDAATFKKLDLDGDGLISMDEAKRGEKK